METNWLDYDWSVMLPEATIAAAVLLLLFIDLLMKKEQDRRFIGLLSLFAVLAAGVAVAFGFGKEQTLILDGSYLVDDFSKVFKLLILGGTTLILLSALSQEKSKEIDSKGEFYYLLLAATLGGMVMVSSADLITLFVGLEILSIASYILVGMRKKRLESVEAAWKYVVMGSVATAFILYGMSFLYGLTGSTNLDIVAERIFEVTRGGYDAFVYLSLLLMLVGFTFKAASAPFHMWAPDVYQGAPTPVTTFLAVVSKTAAIAFILRILRNAYLPGLWSMGEWQDVVSDILIAIAVASMIIGNVVALWQTNTKRLLAYSSIAHAGYLLVPLALFASVPQFIVGNEIFFGSIIYYLLAYMLMITGAFAVLTIVERDRQDGDIRAFAGLYRRSPWLAIAMSIFLISLAGIPITAGFFGKFYILLNTIIVRNLWVAGIMMVTTVISYYYYFGIIRQMFFRPPAESKKISIPIGLAIVIVIGVIGTIGLGIMPKWVVEFIEGLSWY